MSEFGEASDQGMRTESIRYAASQSVSPRKSRVALIREGRLTSNSVSKVRSITSGLLPKIPRECP